MAEAMSLQEGSDDASVIYCQPCGNILAEAFCTDCPEYFCSSCANVHEKQRLTSHHKLLRGPIMPSCHTTLGKQDYASFMKCDQHPKEELKLFCEPHEELCCVACNVVRHKQCKVVYIPDFAKDYKTGTEFIQLSMHLNDTEQLAAKHVADIEKIMKAVKQRKTSESTKLEQYRMDLKKYVDKRIDKLLSQVEQMQDTDLTALTEQHSRTKNIKSDALAAKTKLKACEQNPIELFTESKQTRYIVAQLQADLSDVTTKSVYHVYTVRKDKEMESAQQQKTGIATIQLQSLLTPGCFNRQEEINVVSWSESGSFFYDIAVVSTTRVLVADNENKTLRLVDSQNGGVVAKVSLTAKPFRLCAIRDRRAVVTFPTEKRIQFIRIAGDTLSLDRYVDLNGSVVGIAACDNHLVVSYEHPCRVKKITMEGKVTHELTNQTPGKELFKFPRFIAISESKHIFISDSGTNTITQLDETLQVVQTITSPLMKSVTGIVSVNTTQLLVSGWNSHNILVLDTTTGSLTTLLGQAEKIHNPGAVAWCPDSKTLYICPTHTLVKTITKFKCLS